MGRPHSLGVADSGSTSELRLVPPSWWAAAADGAGVYPESVDSGNEDPGGVHPKSLERAVRSIGSGSDPNEAALWASHGVPHLADGGGGSGGGLSDVWGSHLGNTTAAPAPLHRTLVETLVVGTDWPTLLFWTFHAQ
eukprot:357816-Chlamydomonas_euryale.AAC.1